MYIDSKIKAKFTKKKKIIDELILIHIYVVTTNTYLKTKFEYVSANIITYEGGIL